MSGIAWMLVAVLGTVVAFVILRPQQAAQAVTAMGQPTPPPQQPAITSGAGGVELATAIAKAVDSAFKAFQ